MKKNRKLLPLISSLTLLSTPIILVTACSYEITRYPAALPNDQQNRILFDFINVNYSVDAKSYFNSIFQQGMEYIKKDVEGIIAQEEFIKFFIEKLGYTEAVAKEAFTEIKDNLGLNILAADYFTTVNNGDSFDNKDTTKLIFQTDNWHKEGTTAFEYNEVEYYRDHNPNTIFTPGYLYANLNDQSRDNEIKDLAKHADEFYNKEITALTQNKLKWSGGSTPEQTQPTIDVDNIQDYQKKLERFKWWLRFRYQQYYSSVIVPQLNQTLFTMANILKSILTFNSANNTINITNSSFASQLQNWGANNNWRSNYRLVWENTVTEKEAENINTGWTEDTPKLPDLMLDSKTLNQAFFSTLTGTDETVKYGADAIFGVNGFISDTSSKSYNSELTDPKKNNAAAWAKNYDNYYYWNKNNKGSFVYSTPIYWIDVVQNLDFKFYQNRNNADPKENHLFASDPAKLTEKWNSADNSALSGTPFSQYIRAEYIADTTTTKEEWVAKQSMKWNIFWQMIYWLSSQIDSNPNKEKAADNFETSAKVLFPEYIAKDKIYNIDFWNAVSSYY